MTELVPVVANLATVTDIAVRAGSPEDAAEQWVTLYSFPRPLIPEAAGGRVWWWPDVRKFILRHAAELAGYIQPADVMPVSRPRPAGKRGRNPGPSVLTAFDIRQLHAMHGQVDDQGRPRFTLEQIAASMSRKATAQTIHLYAPARRRPPGLGGDARALEPGQIARLRVLRAEKTPDGKLKYTQRELAAMFGTSDMTVSRYTRDMQLGTPRKRRKQPLDAEGQPIADELVRRVQAMSAERTGSGEHRYTREQVAGACGVTVATVGRLERNVTAPPAGRGETHDI